jgi:hypothetical protein
MALSDSFWHWRLAGTGVGERALYSRFMTQLVHWLAPSRREIADTGLIQAFTADSEVDIRAPVVIGAVLGSSSDDAAGPAPVCRITTPDGKRLNLPMAAALLGAEVGLNSPTAGYKCAFVPETAGRHELEVMTADGTRHAVLPLLAREAVQERTGRPANRGYLLELARATGGRFIRWDERDRLFEDMPYRERTLTITREYPIWNRVWWLLLLIALFGGEWWWRRRLDLV